jgi:hypothetical protein
MSLMKLIYRSILEAIGGATAGFVLYALVLYEAQYLEICNYPSPRHQLGIVYSSWFTFVVDVLKGGWLWALIGATSVLCSCYMYRLWRAADG